MELGASTAEVFVPCGPPDRHGRRDRRPRRTPVGRAGAGGLRCACAAALIQYSKIRQSLDAWCARTVGRVLITASP
jgi:hypothetical protein